MLNPILKPDAGCIGKRERQFPGPIHTWVSGSLEPKLAAPSLTTSASWVMVAAEDWAAWASLSGVDAAPDTSSLVSSTKAFAVFRMFSLGKQGGQRDGRNRTKPVHLQLGRKEILSRGL